MAPSIVALPRTNPRTAQRIGRPPSPNSHAAVSLGERRLLWPGAPLASRWRLLVVTHLPDLDREPGGVGEDQPHVSEQFFKGPEVENSFQLDEMRQGRVRFRQVLVSIQDASRDSGLTLQP